MKYTKPLFLTGTTIITLTLSGAGIASAHSNTDQHRSDHRTQLSQRVQSNVKKDAAKPAIEQNKANNKAADRWAEIQERRTAALQRAVDEGKLTQDQANHITNAWGEIDGLVDQARTATDPAIKQATWNQIKQKFSDLKGWADSQNIDKKFVWYFAWSGHHWGWFKKSD